MSTINTKISVGRKDNGVGKRLGHANEASVGEAHRNTRIFFNQLNNWLYVFGKLEADGQGGTPKEGAEAWRTKFSEKVVDL